MATRQDQEGGSRLWRGMRHLIFGEDSEPTLREEIEEAIDEAEDSRPIAGDLSPAERSPQTTATASAADTRTDIRAAHEDAARSSRRECREPSFRLREARAYLESEVRGGW